MRICLLALLAALGQTCNAQVRIDSLGRIGINTLDTLESTMCIGMGGFQDITIATKSTKRMGMYLFNSPTAASGLPTGMMVRTDHINEFYPQGTKWIELRLDTLKYDSWYSPKYMNGILTWMPNYEEVEFYVDGDTTTRQDHFNIIRKDTPEGKHLPAFLLCMTSRDEQDYPGIEHIQRHARKRMRTCCRL